MTAESISFIDEVLSNGSGTLQELLGADWTYHRRDLRRHRRADRRLLHRLLRARRRSGPTFRRNRADGAAGGTRVGILNQGAFLSRFATATGSHPVRRGVAVMRRVACLDLPDPAELDINVIPPVPDPNMPKTTRDALRRARHRPALQDLSRGASTTSASRSSCTTAWAPSAPTARRPSGRAAGTVMLPIDTTTTVAGTGTDLDGDYADSNALARVLSSSATVRACMARQLFRASTGRGDASVRGAEDNFVSRVAAAARPTSRAA